MCVLNCSENVEIVSTGVSHFTNLVIEIMVASIATLFRLTGCSPRGQQGHVRIEGRPV